MCIIAYIPQGHKINKETLDIMVTNNPDGNGVMWVENSELRMFKTFKTNKLWKLIDYLQNSVDTPIIVHARIATHGTVDLFNCHPFSVHKDLAFAHNGVISGIGICPTRSDTQVFNETILQKLPTNFLSNPAIVSLIRSFTFGSKLVFLNTDMTVTIVNEPSGNTKDGIWYSNLSHEPKKIYTRPAIVYYPDKPKVTNWYTDNPGWDTYKQEKAKKEDIELGDRCECCNLPLQTRKESVEGICNACCASISWHNPPYYDM